MSAQVGMLFVEPYNRPLSSSGQIQANCYRKFFLTGTTTLATVYQDAALQNPYSQTPTPITADGSGRFSPIYLDPAVVYRSQLFSATNSLLEDADPIIPLRGGYVTKVKPANTNRASNITPSNDPDLVINVPVPGTYLYEAFLQFGTAGATGNNPGAIVGIDYNAALTAGFQMTNAILGQMNGGFGNAGALNVNSNYGLLTDGPGPRNSLFIRGTFTCTAAGVLSVQWSQQTSNATATYLVAGSTFTLQQLA